MSSLESEATSFAREIADSVSAFVGTPVEFTATSAGTRFVVTDSAGSGVVLELAQQANLTLEVNYRCEMDASDKYLKVLASKIAVYAGKRPKGDPLFRFEYLHGQHEDLPASHLHVHAHRDQFTRVMTLAGVNGASRRQTGPDAELESARLAQLHFPLGGHRFRPCLEDVMQMIAVEFGYRPSASWPETLDQNRERWRRHQTGSAVRDCPSEAVRVLQELNYTISTPAAGVVSDRLDRLRAY